MQVLSDNSTPPASRHRPLVELLILAGPTIMQMASYTLMQFVDTMMLSRIGVDEPTAAGQSGMLGFAVICFGFGVLWIVNTLVSQNFGARRFDQCGRYLWQGFYFAVVYCIVLAPAIWFADYPFHLFGHAPRLAAMEGIYLRITLSFAIVKLIGTASGQFLLAINRPVMVLASAAAGVAVNALAAWALIFGHLGSAPHGVVGSAWGQNIGVCVETSVLLAVVFTPWMRQTYATLDARFRSREWLLLLKIGSGAGIQFVADVLAWSLFGMWVMGKFGTPAMAANNFMMRYMAVSFMPAVGISVAVTALVGRYIGAGRPDIARKRATLGFVVALFYMTACGLLFFLGRNFLMRGFTGDREVVDIGAKLLCFAAVYQFFDAFYIVYVGALRGAGDTIVPGLATGGLCWGITVMGGYGAARYFPRLGPSGPWMMATIYGILLGMFMYIRFNRQGWRRIHLTSDPQSGEVSKLSRDSVTLG